MLYSAMHIVQRSMVLSLNLFLIGGHHSQRVAAYGRKSHHVASHHVVSRTLSWTSKLLMGNIDIVDILMMIDLSVRRHCQKYFTFITTLHFNP